MAAFNVLPNDPPPLSVAARNGSHGLSPHFVPTLARVLAFPAHARETDRNQSIRLLAFVAPPFPALETPSRQRWLRRTNPVDVEPFNGLTGLRDSIFATLAIAEAITIRLPVACCHWSPARWP